MGYASLIVWGSFVSSFILVAYAAVISDSKITPEPVVAAASPLQVEISELCGG